MRPTLTLKKKPVPAPLVPVATPAEPAQPVEPAVSVPPVDSTKPAKPAKQSPQTEKEARTAANRLLNEAQHARRLAQWDRLKPLVEAYCSDQALFRETVLVDGVECLRPLAIGVHKTLFAWLREQPDAQGASNILLMDLIKAVLRPHVAQPRYLAGLLRFQNRFDLDGNAAGVVEDKHKARAEKALQKLKAMPEGEPSPSS